MNNIEKKLCKVCSQLGDCDGTIDKCANCWEVEKRLEDYLNSPGGRSFVLEMLNAAVEKASKEKSRVWT